MSKRNFFVTELSFPVISIIGKEFIVSQTPQDYFVCKKDYIPELSKLKENVIDANGIQFIRGKVSFVKYINAFQGFSLKAGGFGVAYVHKQIDKIKDLSVDELKEIGQDIMKSKRNHYVNVDINIKNWKVEFKLLNDKDEVLRYMFFFADTHRFYHPGIRDNNWRKRRGYVKYVKY